MFRALMLLMTVLIYLCVICTIVAGALLSPAAAELLGLGTPSATTYGLGALAGTVVAVTVFGLPIILLSIHSRLAEAVEILETMRRPPDLLTSVAPVLVDHALESLTSD